MLKSFSSFGVGFCFIGSAVPRSDRRRVVTAHHTANAVHFSKYHNEPWGGAAKRLSPCKEPAPAFRAVMIKFHERAEHFLRAVVTLTAVTALSRVTRVLCVNPVCVYHGRNIGGGCMVNVPIYHACCKRLCAFADALFFSASLSMYSAVIIRPLVSHFHLCRVQIHLWPPNACPT